jgi:hypothetical protein
MTFLDSVGINISDCRGQSYDNASNMSGKYAGVQALVKELSPHAIYIPCFGGFNITRRKTNVRHMLVRLEGCLMRASPELVCH